MKAGSSSPYPRFLRVCFLVISIFSIPVPRSEAMVINLTYDSSITGLTNAAQVEAAINLAAQVLDNLYTNVMTVNITVFFDSTIDLGQSQTDFTGNPTYSQITNYLRSARTTAAASNSVASLPANDPTSGGTWWIPYSEAKAFGGVFGISTNRSGEDGQVRFASTVTYALNPTNRAVPFASDLIAVAEHEISEVLGRGYALNYNLGAGGYMPYDLFRFTNSAARSLNVNATNAYFSVDNGVTSLAPFFPDYTAGDPQDWQSRTLSDSYDAFLTEGTEGYLSYADLISLNVLGYKLNFRPPKLSAARLTNGNMQLIFTNVTGLGFSILASTNIAAPVSTWLNLGVPKETSVGNYQFIDTTANKARFYRAVLN